MADGSMVKIPSAKKKKKKNESADPQIGWGTRARPFLEAGAPGCLRQDGKEGECFPGVERRAGVNRPATAYPALPATREQLIGTGNGRKWVQRGERKIVSFAVYGKTWWIWRVFAKTAAIASESGGNRGISPNFAMENPELGPRNAV